MTMQRRHYNFIAETIREIKDAGYRADVAQHFADRLRYTNPNFNRARFLEACGVKDT